MELIHNKTAKQYEYHERPIDEVSPMAFVRYEEDGTNLYITKVEVPTRFMGKNIGKKMLADVIYKSGLRGLKVKPKCQEAFTYMKEKGFSIS